MNDRIRVITSGTLTGPVSAFLAVAFCLVVASSVLTSACSGQQQTPAQTAATAASVRDLVCTQVALMAPTTPELEQVNRLCRDGAMLKPIAAAYAGCQVPAESPPVAPPSKPAADPGIQQPWPADAGAEPPSGSSP